MTRSDEFNIKWLFDKYDYMLTTHQHIPNTKQWEFIDRVCRAYYYSEKEDHDLDEQDYKYIKHIIYDNFMRKMTDNEIRSFENERSDFLFTESYKKVYTSSLEYQNL